MFIQNFITQYFSIVWLYRNLFLHLPVDGHVGCFQFGAIQIKLLRTFVCKASYGPKISFLLGTYLEKDLGTPMSDTYLGHVVTLSATF